MARIKVNLTNVDSFEVFPDGNYLFAVVGISKAEDSGGLNWKIRVAEGGHEGAITTHYTSFKPQALWNLKSLCDALGVDYDEDGFDDEECMDGLFYADAHAEEYKEKMYMKLDPSSFAKKEIPF